MQVECYNCKKLINWDGLLYTNNGELIPLSITDKELNKMGYVFICGCPLFKNEPKKEQ